MLKSALSVENMQEIPRCQSPDLSHRVNKSHIPVSHEKASGYLAGRTARQPMSWRQKPSGQWMRLTAS
jgi:hypothetical protein